MLWWPLLMNGKIRIFPDWHVLKPETPERSHRNETTETQKRKQWKSYKNLNKTIETASMTPPLLNSVIVCGLCMGKRLTLRDVRTSSSKWENQRIFWFHSFYVWETAKIVIKEQLKQENQRKLFEKLLFMTTRPEFSNSGVSIVFVDFSVVSLVSFWFFGGFVSVVSFRCFGGFGGSGGFGDFVSMVSFLCFGFQYMPPGLYL